MTITLYNNNAEKNRVNKKPYLVELVTLTGTPRSNCSIISPVITVELNAPRINELLNRKYFVLDDDGTKVTTNGVTKVLYTIVNKILTSNYCYILDFNRYYYISDISIVGKDLWQISLNIDVLMSYSNQIMNTNCLVARSQSKFNMLIEDKQINFEFEKQVAYDKSNVKQLINFTTNDTMAKCFVVTALCVDGDMLKVYDVQADGNLPYVNNMLQGGLADMTATYVITRDQLYTLMSQVYSDDTLKSYIKSVMVVPFQPTVPDYNETGGVLENIIIGDKVINFHNAPLEYASLVKYKNCERIKVASITFPKFTEFTQYEPYTSYFINVPFKDEIKVNSSDINGSTIDLYYNVNYETGEAIYFLYNTSTQRVISQGSCVLGVRVGVSSTNSLEIQNQKIALAVQTTLGVLASGSSIAFGAASGNPVAVVGGVMSSAKTISNAVTGSMQLYERGQTATSTASGGLIIPNDVYIKTVKTVKINDTGYITLYGRPLQEYTRLGDLSGMTVVDEMHLEHFGTATDGELNEIENLLKSGVIL